MLLFCLELLNLSTHHEQTHLCFLGSRVNLFDILTRHCVEIGLHLTQLGGELCITLSKFLYLTRTLTDKDFHLFHFLLSLLVVLAQLAEQILKSRSFFLLQ